MIDVQSWINCRNGTHIIRILTAMHEHPQVFADCYDDDVQLTSDHWNCLWNRAHDALCSTDDARWPAWRLPDRKDNCAIDCVRTRNNGANTAMLYAIESLLVYEDCADFLQLSVDELRTVALLTEHPGAVFLVPVVDAISRIERDELDSKSA